MLTPLCLMAIVFLRPSSRSLFSRQLGAFHGSRKKPFEAVQAMMLENLEKVGGATQTYIDMVEKTMPGFPGANEEQIGTFKATSSGKLQPTETSGRSFCNPGIFGRSSAFRSNTRSWTHKT
jgi:hypothetical protein